MFKRLEAMIRTRKEAELGFLRPGWSVFMCAVNNIIYWSTACMHEGMQHAPDVIRIATFLMCIPLKYCNPFNMFLHLRWLRNVINVNVTFEFHCESINKFYWTDSQSSVVVKLKISSNWIAVLVHTRETIFMTLTRRWLFNRINFTRWRFFGFKFNHRVPDAVCFATFQSICF